ncbi:hypothetical protein OF001_U20004 [Pseudomonas sp. OF001]|nr:hypothetical protein OF001_U20004 [Pseudomonas sp. OF001]
MEVDRNTWGNIIRIYYRLWI